MRKIAVALCALALAVGAMWFGLWRFGHYLGDLPDASRLEEYTPRLVTRLYDVRGELIAELFTERRDLVPLPKIPVHLQNAVIAIEDDRFFRHWGISLRGLARASIHNLIAGRVVQGGSTITQQLSKILFLKPRKTFERKAKEMLLALQLERDYTKQELLSLYMNQVYFGQGAYGVEAAARIFFGKPVGELTLPECAMLAGTIRAPSRYSPFKDLPTATGRRNLVLSRMRELGYITGQELQDAIKNPVRVNPAPANAAVRAAPYFVEYIRQDLEPRYGMDTLNQAGLNIYTTLDLKMQLAAEKIIGARLDELEKNIKSSSTIQGAFVCLDSRTGAIRAMVGGRDFGKSQFNRAVQARRQPGSAFKIFTYTAAIADGMFTPVSVLQDTPLHYYNDGRDWRLLSRTTDFSDADTTFVEDLIKRNNEIKEPEKKILWSPLNYTKLHHGPVLLRRALEHSLNICAIQVCEQVGPRKVVEYARKMGIESPLQANLSITLGSNEVFPMEMARAAATLANSGIRPTPYAITKITKPTGELLEDHRPQLEEGLPAEMAYEMTYLLRGVVDRGTGRAAKLYGRSAAGKTGTTNEFKDAWFVGYTPQLAAAVWVGFDDRRPLGPKKTGGAIAAPIWGEFMRGAHKGLPVQDFPVPPKITFAKIDPASGLLALGNPPGTYLEAFIRGTEPKEFSLGQGMAVTAEIPEEAAGGVIISTAMTAEQLLQAGTTRAAPVLPVMDDAAGGGY